MKQTSNVFLAEMTSFFTRQAGNEGVQMPLYNPVTGEKSEHWLRVVSVDSDIYSRANSKAMREARKLADTKLTDEEKAERLEEQKLDLVASLVIAWSFDMPCTFDNVRAFLAEAPQILESVNQLAGNRPLFMMGSSRSSEPSPKPTSSSAESHKDQKPQSENS